MPQRQYTSGLYRAFVDVAETGLRGLSGSSLGTRQRPQRIPTDCLPPIRSSDKTIVGPAKNRQRELVHGVG
uniref:hypothetical protein n=1 Tax=Mycobacterium sp. HUMS_1102779 TaxID=3383487 RepID=UPI003899A7B8